MANFERLFHWESFTPNLGNNRELLADQLTLEIAVGMTKVELVSFLKGPVTARGPIEAAVVGDEAAAEVKTKQNDDAYVARLAEAWAPFVRLGPGNHSVNGKPLTGLTDYLGTVLEQPGIFNFIELQQEVTRLNSVEGTRALFSAPPAGGFISTVPKSSAPAGSQTGGR